MDQITLEQNMLQTGADRYLRSQDKAAKRHELTNAQESLFRQAVGRVMQAMEQALEDAKGPGAKPSWHLPVTTLGPLKCAVLTLRRAFDMLPSAMNGYVPLMNAIGKLAEVEMIAKAVEEKDLSAYKKIVKKAKSLPGTAFKGKVITEMAQEEGFWDPLPDDELVKMGAGLFNFVLQATDLFVTYLDGEGTAETCMGVTFTKETVDRLKEITEREAWMCPVYRPMLTPPAPWEDAFTGCYQDPRVAKTFKVIKTGNREHLEMVNQAMQRGAPFVKALNAIQAVPLRINSFVLEWVEKAYAMGLKVKSFPPKTVPQSPPKDAPPAAKRETKRLITEVRSAQQNFLRDLAEAKEYQTYGTFYLPAQLDWRGRVYAKPHLNHQREDHCKALFEFANGKPLDPMGAVWLAIQVATTGAFDKMDKEPLDARYAWTRENSDRIVEMVKNPAGDLWWIEADSPFCFLAACKAWADYQEQGDAYVCHLPVNVDGSCSGLQHFSAMLRDPIGATHVNLEPQERPADVYRAVAEIVLPLVEADAAQGNTFAQRWLSIGITRKIAKRCVMTYVYGSKQYGFSEHLAEDFAKELEEAVTPTVTPEDGEEPWAFKSRVKREIKATATYLASHIWKAVQSTVKAAAEGMDWLQEVAGLMATENKAVQWVTPMGFPVVNAYMAPKLMRVELMLYDKDVKVPVRFQGQVKTGETKDLMKRKCRSSISPNFVHSMDASALQAAVVKAAEEGITDTLLIHDSFGCLPSDMPRFVQIVRETFVEQYENHDPIQDLHDRALGALSDKGKAKLPPAPVKGDFYLQRVLESHYAFA